MVVVGNAVNKAHVGGHLLGVIGGDEHPAPVFVTCQRRAAYKRSVSCFGKGHQPGDKFALLRRWPDIDEVLVQLRLVQPDVLSCLVVGYLVIEQRQLRYFDEVPEPLFRDDLVGNGEFEVSCLTRKDRRPSVEVFYMLPFHLFWPQVLEQQVHLG